MMDTILWLGNMAGAVWLGGESTLTACIFNGVGSGLGCVGVMDGSVQSV